MAPVLMAWFFVDDHLHDHRKPRRAGLEAVGLWTLAGSWCADNLTDGFVPREVAVRWGGRKLAKLAAQLVAADLWETAELDGETGWQFHDWEEWQRTREQVEALRAKRSAAGARGGRKSGQTRSKPEASASPSAQANGNQKRTPRADAPPALPIPKEQTPLPPDAANEPNARVLHPAGRETRSIPKGFDGHPRHHLHDNAKAWCVRVTAERKLPIDAAELLAWCYRFGDGDPWAGHRDVDRHTSHQLDSATQPSRALRARFRDAIPQPRTDADLTWLKDIS